jgi:hypothetical protein
MKGMLKVGDRSERLDLFRRCPRSVKRAFFVGLPSAVLMQLEGTREIHVFFRLALIGQPFDEMRTFHTANPRDAEVKLISWSFDI